MAGIASGCAEKETPPSFYIPGHDFLSGFARPRIARKRAKEGDDLPRLRLRQRNRGHLGSRNPLDRIANDLFIRSAVFPLAAGQVRPAPAFRGVAVTGR